MSAFICSLSEREIVPPILGHYQNGPLEGFNNKAQTVKRQAYGYRDMDYFKLLTPHQKKSALTG